MGATRSAIGLVASLNRPGGNVTGVTFLASELGAKQLGLLHQLWPRAARIGVIVDPNWPLTAALRSQTSEPWPPAIGKRIEVLNAKQRPRHRYRLFGLCAKPR